jgi:hypothetical protein
MEYEVHITSMGFTPVIFKQEFPVTYRTQVEALSDHAADERPNGLFSSPKGQNRLSGQPSLLSDE